MDDSKNALITELQKKEGALEVRLDNQYDATQNILRRLAAAEKRIAENYSNDQRGAA